MNKRANEFGTYQVPSHLREISRSDLLCMGSSEYTARALQTLQRSVAMCDVLFSSYSKVETEIAMKFILPT